MVSDTKILITALPRCLRHDFKRVPAIREVGMGMEDAAYVPVCDEVRKTAFKRLLDFTPAVFPEFWLYERQTKRLVNVSFGCRRYDPTPALQSIRTQRKALAFRQRAQGLHMRRRAGCEKQRDSVALLIRASLRGSDACRLYVAW